MQGIVRADLNSALERGDVVQGTSLRATIHLATPAFFQLSNDAVRDERRDWWIRASRTSDVARLERAADRIREALKAGPRKRTPLMKELGIDSTTWNGATAFLDLIRVPPSGTWENRRADLYALFEWPGTEPQRAREAMVENYLRSFGPASVSDVGSFLGLKPATIKPILKSYRRETSEAGEVLFDVEDGVRPGPNESAPPRFLAQWEANLLVHARRTQILPERYRPLIFNTKIPPSVPTFLVDGQVAGTWAIDADDLQISPFAELTRHQREELDEEAERVRSFIS
jgi:hypothetical protein